MQLPRGQSLTPPQLSSYERGGMAPSCGFTPIASGSFWVKNNIENMWKLEDMNTLEPSLSKETFMFSELH